MGKIFSCCTSKRSQKVQPITIRCGTNGQRDAAWNQESVPRKESYTPMPETMNSGGSMLVIRTDGKAHPADGDQESDGIRPRNPSPPADSSFRVDEVANHHQPKEATRKLNQEQRTRIKHEDVLEVK